MDYKISQALNDLKNYYGLEDFKEVQAEGSETLLG